MCQKSERWVICYEKLGRMWETWAVSFAEALNNVWWRVSQTEEVVMNRDLMDGWPLSAELRAKKGA